MAFFGVRSTTTARDDTYGAPAHGAMASAPDATPPPQRVVEVKHGKRKVAIVVEGAATVAWLMEAIESETGVMRKHQKLLCKGKPLVAAETVDAQCAFKNGKATVMLLASAGGGGAPPPPPTAGQQALAASRKSKLDEMVNRRLTRPSPPRPSPSLEDSVKSRVSAWRSTGIVGMREMGLRTIPSEAFAVGPKARVADASANSIAALPSRVAEWSSVTKLALSKNKLTLETVDWEALTTLTALAHLCLDENDIAGALPSSVATAMPSLKTLIVDGNALASLPESEEPKRLASGPTARYFPALERLSFARNKVTRFPRGLGSCARLETIDASHNAIEEIPAALASSTGRLRELRLDGNTKLRARGVPPAFLRDALLLDRLTFHGCDLEMETLRANEGWQTYDARRKKRAGKVLESRVMLGDAAFDEGADVERRKRH